MSAHQHIKNAILLSIGCTGLAVGCSGKEVASDTSVSNTESLSAIPTGNYPECDGQSTEFTSECCIDIYCTEKVNSECPEAVVENSDAITGLGLGTGNCLCEPPEGPYANTDVAAETAANGECCYLVGVQGCAGRPMLVEENLRKAPLIRGKAWS